MRRPIRNWCLSRNSCAAGAFDEWRPVCPLAFRRDDTLAEYHTSARAKTELARLLDRLGPGLFARWHGIVDHRSLLKE